MIASDLGNAFKTRSLENLITILSRTHRDRGLLITSREISRVLNFLAPFSLLKSKGGFDQSLFIDQISLKKDNPHLFTGVSSLVVIISSDSTGFSQLKLLWPLIDHSELSNIDVVVQNLHQSFHQKVLDEIIHASEDVSGGSIGIEDSTSIFRLSARCKLHYWKTLPIIIQDNVFTSNMENGGLSEYINDPLKVISTLSDTIMDIIAETIASGDPIKIKNVYAKGDNSGLLVKNILDDGVPQFMTARLTSIEQEYYVKKLSGNADLVVLERNLDYFPLLMSHTNYMGLLDDYFGTEDELNNILSPKVRLDDDLFHNIKHLNFASVGLKLNKLAKYIQLELEQNDKAKALDEIKELVKNLGDLSSKQDMVRKHTHLCETMLQGIKSNRVGGQDFNAQELWIELQNELFDLDYKSHIINVHLMLERYTPFSIVMNLIVLTSLINDGWRQNDLEAITTTIQQNYGLQGALTLKRLLDHKIIKTHTRGNDFFGSFTFGKTEIETSTASTLGMSTVKLSSIADAQGYEDSATVGITSGQDVYKSTYTLINKFWNLHPPDDMAMGNSAIESVSDYKQPSFTLPSGTVPLIIRIVESLYYRNFLTYKVVNNVQKRPNWQNLNMDTMFKGQTIDDDLCDSSSLKKEFSAGLFRQQYLILVIIGGITRSDISALKSLHSQLDRKILIVTTGLVNNKKFWQAML